MKCPGPISIPRPGGNGNFDRITVPCGKCEFCLENKRNAWSFRVQQEARHSGSAYFVTLTYSEENLPKTEFGIPTLDKQDLQLFLKLLRMKVERNAPGSKIRYYLCGEYGPEGMRPHYHIIIFNLPLKIAEKIPSVWKKGYVTVGILTDARIHYVTKYFLTKNKYPEGSVKPFNMMSLKPGIGYQYLERTGNYHKKNLDFTVRFKSGHKLKIPKYYADKIFNQSDKNINRSQTMDRFDQIEQRQMELRDRIGNGYYTDYISAIENKRKEINKKLTKKAKL